MTVAAGTRIAQYVVEARVGRGGMATVYRVRHAELGTRFALKLLDQRNPAIAARLLAEGRMQASLQHPNVVSVIDVVMFEGCPGLVMEYVDGPTLQQVIAAGRVPPAERDALVTGILYGVRAAHQMGFVHRDLKPGNILLARADDRLIPKVADFGLAKAADDGEPRRTRTGMVFGTPVYMAPEQARSAKDVDRRADVYALGVILYELVTGRLPVDSDDFLELFSRVASRDYPKPRVFDPDLPPHQEAAILAAMDPDRERRIPDCDVLLAAWRGTMRFAPDRSLVTLERTSPFDAAFLQRVATLASAPSTPSEAAGETYEPPATALAPAPVGRTAAVLVGGMGMLGFGALALGAGLVVLAAVGVWAVWPRPAPVADAPIPAPTTPAPAEAIAPSPGPAPAPAPAPAPSAPVGPSPERHPPAATTDRPPAVVAVAGDAERVWLVDGRGRIAPPGTLSPGEYDLYALFAGQRQSPALHLKLAPGERRTVRCTASFEQCRATD